jgi:hypothetical protein
VLSASQAGIEVGIEVDGLRCCGSRASSRLLIVVAGVCDPHCFGLQAFSRLLIVVAGVGNPHSYSLQAFSRLLIVVAEVGDPLWIPRVLVEDLDIDLR